MDDIRTNSPFTIKNIAKIVKDEIPLTHSSLFAALAEEMKHYNPGEHLTLEFNNSILFFCKAKMIEDALCTYKRMREQNIRPTSYTFCHILCGYSSMDMHREITMLWGEIKRRLEYGELDVDRDLLDCLVLDFLKGWHGSGVAVDHRDTDLWYKTNQLCLIEEESGRPTLGCCCFQRN
ncbi:hypothetical protein PVAP13_6NG254520 [Panicum virgatum]|uniref:Pentatricopeptide repeat-containing protein n=1 Tax=Panicum virgatum TaxID=38727 RepID=A0A8T0R4N6_PANVG|nr:hypothetical protein PVAP13_6NG254520 [Panicum virgatum]